MRFQILGTAAAEGWPAIFCACDTCQRARKAGGKNIRSRASLMVNDTIKVDMNADTYHHVVKHNLDLSRLEHVLFTHSHNDHLNVGELGYLRDPFAHCRGKSLVDVWASRDVIEQISQEYPDPAVQGMTLHTVPPFTSIDLDGIPATPIIAHHKTGELCFNWIFGDLQNGVLYASDTGLYKEATWEYLSGVKLDMVIAECTGGFAHEMDQHLHVPSVRQMRETLDKMGALNPGCQWVITHFSHNVGVLHEELEAGVKDDGFIVAYDGIVLEADK